MLSKKKRKESALRETNKFYAAEFWGQRKQIMVLYLSRNLEGFTVQINLI